MTYAPLKLGAGVFFAILPDELFLVSTQLFERPLELGWQMYLLNVQVQKICSASRREDVAHANLTTGCERIVDRSSGCVGHAVPRGQKALRRNFRCSATPRDAGNEYDDGVVTVRIVKRCIDQRKARERRSHADNERGNQSECSHPKYNNQQTW